MPGAVLILAAAPAVTVVVVMVMPAVIPLGIAGTPGSRIRRALRPGRGRYAGYRKSQDPLMKSG